MKLDRKPFDMIRSGEKTYELRLFDEKRQKLSAADTIEFTVNDGTGEKIVKTIKALHRFSDFAGLYSVLPLDKCGYAPGEIVNASPKDMEIYYPKEMQERFGVLAIELV